MDATVLDEIGVGSSRSRVFRCRTASGQAALRRASTLRSGNPTLNEEFATTTLAEVLKLQSLRHPGLLPLEKAVYDPEKGELCLLQPLAKGGSLESAQLNAGGYLGGETLTHVAFSVINALCYLHGRDPLPLVHGVRVEGLGF